MSEHKSKTQLMEISSEERLSLIIELLLEIYNDLEAEDD